MSWMIVKINNLLPVVIGKAWYYVCMYVVWGIPHIYKEWLEILTKLLVKASTLLRNVQDKIYILNKEKYTNKN